MEQKKLKVIKMKAGIFKNLKIGEFFLTSIECDGSITYKKIDTKFADIVKTEGKYQKYLIGNRKFFYNQNMIFQPFNQ